MATLNDFVTWLQEQLNERGWRQADLARYGGMNTGLLSRIMSLERSPGPDTCIAIARALKISPTEVFRKAGILPETEAANDPLLQTAYDLIADMTPEQREQALAYMRFILHSKERPVPAAPKTDPAYEH